MVGTIGAQLGEFVERKRGEDALRAKERQLRVVTGITPVLLNMSLNARDAMPEGGSFC